VRFVGLPNVDLALLFVPECPPVTVITVAKSAVKTSCVPLGVMERMDEQILPALYLWVGEAFHATPSQLGELTLCRALVQALSSPLGGFLGTSL
jgi:hypothetical protein